MTVYTVLLRGINVGGKNIIRMADLKTALETIGLIDVKTYIQSGNILFESDEDEKTLKTIIEQLIHEKFGLSVKVVLRTAAELMNIIKSCPFSTDEISAAESVNNSESLYVALLDKRPADENIEKLYSFKTDDDKCTIINREAYLLFKHSIIKSRLANNLQKLEVPLTVRNWKTIIKLVSLADTSQS